MTRCCKLCVMSHSGVCSIVKTSASLVDDILQLPIPSPLKVPVQLCMMKPKPASDLVEIHEVSQFILYVLIFGNFQQS